jgi:hypothetical protein
MFVWWAAESRSQIGGRYCDVEKEALVGNTVSMFFYPQSSVWPVRWKQNFSEATTFEPRHVHDLVREWTCRKQGRWI